MYYVLNFQTFKPFIQLKRLLTENNITEKAHLA